MDILNIKAQACIDMGNRHLYNFRDPNSDSHSVNLRYLKSFTYNKSTIDSKISSGSGDTSTLVLRDGTNSMTGNLNLDGNRIVNIADGVADGDSINTKQIKEYVEQQTILLKDALPSKVTNNRAVIYSSSGSVHANSLYLKNQYLQEVRFIVEDQKNGTMHLYIPNLLDFDRNSNRPKSDIMIASIEQTVTGKKIFRNIEIPEPTNNNQSVSK